MDVELDSALTRSCDALTLLAICAMGLPGRHRILCDNRTPWNAWATTFGRSLSDELQAAWDRSEEAASRGRRSTPLRVAPSGRSTDLTVGLQLPPQEALLLLARPLRVLLENGRNDRGFLLAFADAAMRTRLEQAESLGWLVFETAGGIGELKVRLKAQKDVPDLQHLRTIYLCDSDAMQPGQLSSEAQEIHGELGKLVARFKAPTGFFGNVLTRRAAENYAPPGMVLTWASRLVKDAHRIIQEAVVKVGRQTLTAGPGNAGSDRRSLLGAIALKELSQTTVVHVIDMKDGRSGTDPTLWNTRLDAFQKAALENGFGKNFSKDFYGSQRGLVDSTGEVSAFLKNVSEQL